MISNLKFVALSHNFICFWNVCKIVCVINIKHYSKNYKSVDLIPLLGSND